MTHSTTPRYGFVGDWPAGWQGGVEIAGRPGVGPRMTEDKCESCGRLIQETGECGCSE